MSRARNGWVLPVSLVLALLLGLVPLPGVLQALRRFQQPVGQHQRQPVRPQRLQYAGQRHQSQQQRQQQADRQHPAVAEAAHRAGSAAVPLRCEGRGGLGLGATGAARGAALRASHPLPASRCTHAEAACPAGTGR